MARVLTTGEKAYQRRSGQWTRFYLTGCLGNTPYSTVYTAVLTTPLPISNDDVIEINYTTGVGTLADVIPHMTMYVGTSAGAYDLGFVRIRKAPTSNVFYIAEASDIDWLTAPIIYLTVVDDYMLTAKQIYQVGKDTFYMDVDVAYSDQNTNPDPTPRMGTHRVAYVHGTIDGAHPTTITLGPESGYPSFVMDGTSITSVTWSAVGPASVSFDDTHAINPVATITKAGKYVFYLSVLGSNGKTAMGVRYAFIHDDTCLPISTINHVELNGDVTSGGWYAEVTIPMQENVATIRDRALCVLFTEDFAMIDGATGTQYTPAAPITGAENIAMVGWIAEETVTSNPEFNEISFRIYGAQYWFQKCSGFVIGVESKKHPTAWIHIAALTVDKTLWHILHWRSTADLIMDFLPSNDTRYAQAFKTSASDLWNQITEIAGPADGQPCIGANPIVDCYGRLSCEIEPQLIPVVDRTWPIVTDITTADLEGIQEAPNWKRDKVASISKIDWSGVAFTAIAQQKTFFVGAPGVVYKRLGQPQASQNWLAYPTQDENNAIGGLLLGWKNNNLPDFELALPVYIHALDIAPRQYINLVIPPEYDSRGEGYSDSAIIRSIKISGDVKTGSVKTGLTVEAVTLPEVSGIGPSPVPPTPPDPPPVPPPPPPPIPPSPTPGLPPNLAVHIDQQGIFYCQTGGLTPQWLPMNDGLSDINSIVNFEVSVTGKCYCQIGNSEVYYAPSFGASWTLLFDTSNIVVNPESYPYWRNPMIVSMGINRDADDQLLIVAGGLVTIGTSVLLYAYTGGSGGVTLASTSHINTNVNGYYSMGGTATFGNNQWVVTYGYVLQQVAYSVLNAAGAMVSSGTIYGIGNFGEGYSCRGRFASNTVVVPGSTYYISQDNGSSWSELSPTPGSQNSEGCLSNGNGTRLLFGTSTFIQRSGDSGTTWGDTSVFAVSDAVWNLGSDTEWLAAILGQILYTLDFGDTFTNLTGDLQMWCGGFFRVMRIRGY